MARRSLSAAKVSLWTRNLVVAGLLMGLYSCGVNDTRSPETALSSFTVAPGFTLQLLAAEPLIADPVDMEIDEYGRLYVLELHGYPLDKSGTGKIKLLQDRDGDGQMDHS